MIQRGSRPLEIPFQGSVRNLPKELGEQVQVWAVCWVKQLVRLCICAQCKVVCGQAAYQ